MAVRLRQLVYFVIPTGWVAVSALNLFRFYRQRSDIWWTPPPMATPLALSGDRAEVYARGTDLRVLAGAGQVRIGGSVLSVDDIRVRFNNWDQRRAERIPTLMMYSFTLGAALMAVLFALVILMRRR